MEYLAIAVAVVLALVALNKVGMKPARHRDLDTPGLRALLELLYIRGMDGAYLHVAVIASSQFVRVYKCIRGPEHVDLEAHMPKGAYAPLGLEQTRNALEANGFAAVIAEGANPESADDLVVDCGPGTSRALVVTEFLLRNVLRLDPERQCVAHIERAHPNPRAHPGFAVAPGA